MTNIILIGFKNSGKTSVGKLLAKKLNIIFIDTDDLITQEYKIKNNILLNCREISLKHGEEYFRILEKNIIADLDKNNTKNHIISTGGGSILDPENIKNLKILGKIIYLSTPYQTLKSRTFSQAVLPSYLISEQPEKNFENIYKKRKTIYSKIADIEFSTKNKTINIITEELANYIGNWIASSCKKTQDSQ